MKTWNGTRIFALALALLLCLSLLPTSAFAGEVDVQSLLDAYASGDQDALMSLLGAPDSGSEQADSQEPAPQEGETEEQPQQPAAAGDHTHVFVTYEAVKAPTCTEPGLEEAVCMVDGCGVTDQHEIPALGHKFTERIPEEAYLKSETPEDCVHAGVYFLACEVCGESLKDAWKAEYDAVFADVMAQAAQAATEEERNNLEYWGSLVTAGQAAVDAKYAQYTFTVPATGVHNMEYVEGKPATCTEDGHTAYRKCANCDYTEGYEVISATGHTLETVDALEPTCTEEGHTAYQKCANCDYTEGYEVIPVTAHSFEGGVCTVCGAEDPDYVPPVAAEPEATEPEATEPEATEPEATEPETTEPETTEPEATEPEATEPETTEPEATEPETTEPEATEPETTEPEATEPEATEPESTEPEATEPEATEPEATEPETTEPEATEPETTEPEATEPEATEPEAEESKAEEPTVVDPVPADQGTRDTFTSYVQNNSDLFGDYGAYDVYDVTPLSPNGTPLTADETAAKDNIVFTLPFPAGTNAGSHSFQVFHRGENGWEQIPASYLTISETGITVAGWKSFSPFAVLAVNKAEISNVKINVDDAADARNTERGYKNTDDSVIALVGDTLYLKVNNSEVPSGYTIRWFRENSNGGEDEIRDAAGKTSYTVTTSDLNLNVFCTVREDGSDKEAVRSNTARVRQEVAFNLDFRGHGTAEFKYSRIGMEEKTLTLDSNTSVTTPYLLTMDKVSITLQPATEEGYLFRRIAYAYGSGDTWHVVRDHNLQNTADPYVFTVDRDMDVLIQADKENLYGDPSKEIKTSPTKGADEQIEQNKSAVLKKLTDKFDSDVLVSYCYITPIWTDDGVYMTSKEIAMVGGFDLVFDFPNGSSASNAFEVYHYAGDYETGNWEKIESAYVSGDKIRVDSYENFSPFAIVVVPSYTITFDANGGEGTMDPQPVVKGETATLNKNEFTRDGYVFLGWATKADGNVKYKDGASIKPEKNMKLYAVWTNDTVAVTFDANGGSGSMDPQLVAKGQSTVLNANEFEPASTKTGFAGWNTKADGSGDDYADGTSVKFSEDTTLYAQWAKKITVTINKNDGSTDTWTDSATVGADYTLPENPFTVPDGKTFAGYSASTDGSVGFYKAGEKLPIDESATEVILYAIWGDDTALAATVSLSGEYVQTISSTSGVSRLTVIGDTLYASVSDINAPMGTLMYQWIRTDGTTQTRLTEATIGDTDYTPTAADFGYRIFCVVTSTVRSGYRASSGVEIAVEYGEHDRILNDGDPNQNGYPGDLIGAVTGMSYSIDGGVWTEVPAGTVMNDESASTIVTRTVTKPGVYRFRGPAPTYKESSYTLTFKPWYSIAVNVTNPSYGTVRFNPDTAAGTHERVTGYDNVRLVLKGQGEVVTLTPASGYYAYYRVDGGTWVSGVTRTTTGTGATATTTTTSVPVTITFTAVDKPHVIDVQFLAVGTSPRTGDTSNIGLWAALGFASFAGLVTLAGTERKRRKNRA